jgi:uncharacterized protein (TIGR02117 family)
MSHYKLLPLAFLLIFLSSCSKVNTSCLATEDHNSITIYVTNIGWHTGILFPPHSLLLNTLPIQESYPEDHYIEFGWGDKHYYMAQAPGFFDALKAGLLPTKSVLHIAAFPDNPKNLYQDVEIIALNLHEAAYQKLLSFISESIATESDSKSESIGPGHYPLSNFHNARGTFWFLNTCNTWISKALAEAGCRSGWIHPPNTRWLMRRIKRVSQ